MTSIAIVMPVYNRFDITICAVQSVLEQSYSDWVLHVMDDGSVDVAAEFFCANGLSDSRIRHHRHRNMGVGCTRNAALDIIKKEDCYDNVAFLDNDDLWHKDKLAIQIEQLNLHPTASMVGCISQKISKSMTYADINEDVFEDMSCILIDDFAEELIKRNFFFMPASIMFRTETLADFRYSESGIAEDFAAFLHYSLKGHKLLKSRAQYYYERQLSGSLQRSNGAVYKSALVHKGVYHNLLRSSEFIGMHEVLKRASDEAVLGCLWGMKDIKPRSEMLSEGLTLISDMYNPLHRLKAYLKLSAYLVFNRT